MTKNPDFGGFSDFWRFSPVLAVLWGIPQGGPKWGFLGSPGGSPGGPRAAPPGGEKGGNFPRGKKGDFWRFSGGAVFRVFWHFGGGCS